MDLAPADRGAGPGGDAPGASDSGGRPAPEPSDDARVVRVRVFVGGRVQGVGFRAGAAREAARLGVRGWVRNLPDERVEAVYEGPRHAVEDMLAWTRHGPTVARVTQMTIHDEEPQGEQGFGVE